MGRGGDASPSSLAPGGRSKRLISAAELKKHNSAGDCWFAIEGRVFDVSAWQDHPGGRVLYSAAGTDATDSFRAFHSAAGYAALARFEIGELEPKAREALAPSGFEAEYRELYARVKSDPNFYEANYLYYVWKLASTLAIVAASIYVTVTGHSFLTSMCGALLLALFWQQCGWLAHDFAHHQVFRNRRYNDYVVLFVGNFLQAFSLEWWKNKHNTHHAIPNLHESRAEAHDGDPDIDTLPFLAWSERLVAKVRAGGSADSSAARFSVRNQALLYFPILFFARITWALSSLSYAFAYDVSLFGSDAARLKEVASRVRSAAAAAPGAGAAAVAAAAAAAAAASVTGSAGALRYPVSEKVLLVLHYCWFLALAVLPHLHSPATALCFIFVSQTFAGLLLAVAFGVGHNGMEVFDQDKRPAGFAELQIRTTRNVDDNFGVGWFMGGLHFQVEHHLFPFVPRHNLFKLRPVVEPLCRKYGVPYRATGLLEGNAEVLQFLDKVAHTLNDFPAM